MTASHPDVPMAPAPPTVPPDQIDKPKWPYVVAIVVSIVVIVSLLGTIIRLPYVIYSPGGATPVEDVVKITGAKSYRTRGEVLFLTVSVSRDRPNVWRFVQASLDEVLAEVEALSALQLDPALPAMKAIGFRELQAALEGRMEMGEAIERAKIATRQYAKRQSTWFRHQLGPEWRPVESL